MSLPKTGKEARAVGATRFFTGKPCKRGHVALRRASDNACVACVYEKGREWQNDNKDKVRKANKLWRDNNPEKMAALNKAWRTNNPAKTAARVRKYQAEKRNAAPKWLTSQQKLEIDHKYLLARIHEWATGMKWEVDHIAPLQSKEICGLHVPWNLQVIPRRENRTKGNK